MPVVFNPFTGNLDLIDNTAAAGSDTQVQFNDGGVLGGDGGLVFNKTTNALTGGSFIPTSSTVPTNGVYSPGADQVAISTNGTGRLYIDSSGNVGVGTIAPVALLHVEGNSDDTSAGSVALLRVESLGTGTDAGIRFKSAGSTYSQIGSIGGDLYAYANGAERIRLTTDGRLGVGTSSPQYQLHLGGSAVDAANGQIAFGSTVNTPHARVEGYRAGGSFAGQLHLYTTTNSGTQVRAVTVDQAQRVGIGTTSPGVELHVDGDIRCDGVYGETDTNTSIQFPGSDVITFNEGGSEAARIDSSGRLLVGTSTARDAFFNTTFLPGLQLEGAGRDAFASIVRNDNTISGLGLVLGKSRSTSYAVVSNGDPLGLVSFQGADGSEFVEGARIESYVDGTPSANDMPGRLVFSTTADGASSPTEQLRITSDRYVRLASGSGGIQFNGGTAAANALDDYEEGTFTPTLNWTNVTYTFQLGKYTKIGNLVSYTIRITWTANDASPSTIISGLPFSSFSIIEKGTINIKSVALPSSFQYPYADLFNDSIYVRFVTTSGGFSPSYPVAANDAGTIDVTGQYWVS